MEEEITLGEKLTQKQQAELIFGFEEDTDLWLVLFSEYVASQGKSSEELKGMLLNKTDEWKKRVAETKESGFKDLKALACDHIVQWNFRLRQLLQDAGHENILSFYLRSLVSLKTRRVRDVGYRAQTQKQINGILSAIANDAFSALDRYNRATEYIETGLTSGGEPLTDEGKVFYDALRNEMVTHIAALIAVLLLFKGARSQDDIENLQNFISQNLVSPLEAKASALTAEEDSQTKDRLSERIFVYEKLRGAVEISFA